MVLVSLKTTYNTEHQSLLLYKAGDNTGARARESRNRPRVGERRAREGRRATALAPGESGRYRLALARAGAPARAGGGREGGESEARHWRGESDVARSDWSTCRDLIGPRVLAVTTSRF
jgi:hypothetical protein